MKIIKPKPLNKGGVVGICSPAWSLEKSGIASVSDLFRSKGYKVKIHPHIEERHATLSGDVQQRVDAIHDLIKDPKIDAIVFSRGGYGCMQLVEHLDFDLIKANPKIIIGHSDNTALLLAIHARTGLVTFHGPNAYKLLPGNEDEVTTRNMFEVISGKKPLCVYPDSNYAPEVVCSGEVEGKMMGGNHILMHSLIGTPYMPDCTDCIFFMESNLPKFYDVDQDMYHLRFSGTTRYIKGLIVGEMKGVHSHVEKYANKDIGRSFADMSRIHFPDIPSVVDFPCGHHKTLLTFALGIRYRLSLGDNGTVILEQLEPACE